MCFKPILPQSKCHKLDVEKKAKQKSEMSIKLQDFSERAKLLKKTEKRLNKKVTNQKLNLAHEKAVKLGFCSLYCYISFFAFIFRFFRKI